MFLQLKLGKLSSTNLIFFGSKINSAESSKKWIRPLLRANRLINLVFWWVRDPRDCRYIRQRSSSTLRAPRITRVYTGLNIADWNKWISRVAAVVVATNDFSSRLFSPHPFLSPRLSFLSSVIYPPLRWHYCEQRNLATAPSSPQPVAPVVYFLVPLPRVAKHA